MKTVIFRLLVIPPFNINSNFEPGNENFTSFKMSSSHLAEVILPQFYVFFLIKNVLVQRRSHFKGLHVRAKFLPVPDDWT